MTFDVSVTSLPVPQSFGSGENAFLERQRYMPNSGLALRANAEGDDLLAVRRPADRAADLELRLVDAARTMPSPVIWPMQRSLLSS